MLEVEQVHTYYGDSHILHGVTLGVGQGEVVGLLGRNGAGKTTTIASIVGFVRPRAGSIRFRGVELAGQPPHAIARLGLGLVPQGRRIFRSLTVHENLLVARREPGDGPAHGWSLEQAYARFPRLQERSALFGDQLSGGEQQMLAVARALLTRPRLLLLDEPSEGLAPRVVDEIASIIVDLKRAGMPILLVEQHLPLALAVADRVFVMNKGTIVFEGSPQALVADEAVHRRFLGV
ncbi:MAG: ABC transporter ATP-binding protein [Chloroflexota bacterium]|nr:ABC transporter ATP-binding protein [Chloroflexota bacterium]